MVPAGTAGGSVSGGSPAGADGRHGRLPDRRVVEAGQRQGAQHIGGSLVEQGDQQVQRAAAAAKLIDSAEFSGRSWSVRAARPSSAVAPCLPWTDS
jgi:hypothetical protein